ncbi:MAG TPA: hypothetical protein VMJ10_35610 [Kofleriaceae bacterium]|nr:hypothetical protein [Kofleriaceae bacterium]
MKRALAFIAVTAVGACGSFQDPNIVVDLRVISMTASVPEQVIDIDLENPPPAAQILPQLVPSTVCALVADPDYTRRLRWSLTMCPQTDDDLCSDTDPQVLLGSGLLDDPDITVPEPKLCGTIQPDGDLIGVVESELAGDSLHGLQGVQYEVLLHVGGEGADPSDDVYAGKALQLAARVPAQRTANTNPYLTEVDGSIDGAAPVALPLGRCVDQTAPLQIKQGHTMRLLPIEPPGIHETYVIPTLDGGYETFTESITYQWTAGNGSYSDGDTGGTRDAFGNEPPIFTDWTAPQGKSITGPTDVPLWVVQRDERLGEAWYEMCVEVDP